MIKERFIRLIEKYSANEKTNRSCWNEIQKKYSSPSRHYHTLTHLANMFSELEDIQAYVKEPDTLSFSVFYHDIIYNPLAGNNERKSAQLLKKRLSQTRFPSVSACMLQIKATRHHQHSTENDTNVLIDADLSILGKPRNQYENYCRNIRKEYSMYPGFLYNHGRKQILKKFLGRHSIFQTEFFRNTYEETAQKNLQWELNSLRS